MAEQKPVKFHQQNLINKTYNKKVGKLCTIIHAIHPTMPNL